MVMVRSLMPGSAAIDVIAEILPVIIRTFPWPKSMRWGAGMLTWVRPLHSIVCTFGPETEEPEIVRFEIGGITSGDVTHGHPVLAPGPIKVKRLDDYLQKLEKAKVVADRERRKAAILTDAKNLALAQGLELVEDEGLLELVPLEKLQTVSARRTRITNEGTTEFAKARGGVSVDIFSGR